MEVGGKMGTWKDHFPRRAKGGVGRTLKIVYLDKKQIPLALNTNTKILVIAPRAYRAYVIQLRWLQSFKNHQKIIKIRK